MKINVSKLKTLQQLEALKNHAMSIASQIQNALDKPIMTDEAQYVEIDFDDMDYHAIEINKIIFDLWIE